MQEKEIKGKAPADVKDFYLRFATATPSTGEEDEDKADDGGGKKGKKEKGKKEKGKKGGKKGKGGGGGGDGGDTEVIKIGPTEVVTKFEEQQEEYIDNW